MAYTKYSLTPANNNAAPPDGAPEGMLPSAVNDTMRDMMAQIRDVGDGIRGGTYTMTAPVITGGSITGVALSGNTLTSPVISGGSINNTPIGASTANTGNFTTLGATGVATFSAGTVSAPAITTTGDTNTGIFFPAADTIAFTEGGVESMRIDSSGNLGLGTSTAAGSNGKGIAIYASDFPRLSFRNSTTGDATTDGTQILVNGANFFISNNENGATVFENNGSERMRITSTGDVAIGASSTNSRLLAASAINYNESVVTGAASGFLINNAGQEIAMGGSGNAPFSNYIQSRVSGIGWPLVLNPLGGNVGIGTSSPAVKLDVAGEIRSTGGTTQLFMEGVSGNDGFIGTRSNHGITFRTNNANVMRIDSSGNVGIGTSSPSSIAKLAVSNLATSENGSIGIVATGYLSSFTGTFIRQGDTAATGTTAGLSNANLGQLAFQNCSAGLISTNGGSPLVFGTSAAERMRIDASGNVGIGTSSPAFRLDVGGQNGTNIAIRSTGTSSAILRGYVNSAESGVIGFLNGGGQYFETAGTERMRIDSSGNLLVGATSTVGSAKGYVSCASGSNGWTTSVANNANLLFNGYNASAAQSFYVEGTGQINSTSIVINAISDQLLKENIKDIDTGLDSIMALKPRRFDWKEGKGQDKKNVAGFIAQEFEKVFPECVGLTNADSNGIKYKNINHETLIPTLVKAIQEQQTLINNLTTRLNALEGK
jgi:hypothetical protein